MEKAYKEIFIVLILSSILATKSTAQNIKINANPFHISDKLPRTFGIQIENKLNLHNSLGLGIETYYLEPNHSGDGQFKGFKANFAYRRYFDHSKMYQGFFISPSINYLRTDIPEGDEPIVSLKSGTRTGFGVGLQVGQQFIAGSNIILGYSFGPAYYRNTTKTELVNSSKKETSGNNREFNLNFNFGWLIK